MSVSTYIWLGVLAVIAIYGIVIYNGLVNLKHAVSQAWSCLLYTSPSPRD